MSTSADGRPPSRAFSSRGSSPFDPIYDAIDNGMCDVDDHGYRGNLSGSFASTPFDSSVRALIWDDPSITSTYGSAERFAADGEVNGNAYTPLSNGSESPNQDGVNTITVASD